MFYSYQYQKIKHTTTKIKVSTTINNSITNIIFFLMKYLKTTPLFMWIICAFIDLYLVLLNMCIQFIDYSFNFFIFIRKQHELMNKTLEKCFSFQSLLIWLISMNFLFFQFLRFILKFNEIKKHFVLKRKYCFWWQKILKMFFNIMFYIT